MVGPAEPRAHAQRSNGAGPRTALVTGATAGIGAAFSRQLAAAGYRLVLVARSPDRLASASADLQDRYEVPSEILPADLTTDAGCACIEDRLRDTRHPVDLLVNNAGLSINKAFLRSTLEEEERLVMINVRAVLRLTHAVLPGMVDRRSGSVINVSSVSGFSAVMPGSTYPASKAWVTNFSESTAHLVKRFGVRVMALCPGYTRTEFHQRAGIDMSKIPEWMWLDADSVARDGLRDLRKGKLISVPGWKYKAAVFGLRHLPRALLRAAARDTRGRLGPDEQ